MATAPRPEVTITSPAEGNRLRANADSTIIASIFDPAGITTNVQFYVDGIKVSDNTTYFSWKPTQTGSHALQAVALTSDCDTIYSTPVNVVVVVMYPPVVTLESPANEQNFSPSQQPLLRALATDQDGAITNLVLTLDAVEIGATNGHMLEILATNITAAGMGCRPWRLTTTDWKAFPTPCDFILNGVKNHSIPMPEQLAAQALSATEIELSWLPVATNELTQSILIERWDAPNRNGLKSIRLALVLRTTTTHRWILSRTTAIASPAWITAAFVPVIPPRRMRPPGRLCRIMP